MLNVCCQRVYIIISISALVLLSSSAALLAQKSIRLKTRLQADMDFVNQRLADIAEREKAMHLAADSEFDAASVLAKQLLVDARDGLNKVEEDTDQHTKARQRLPENSPLIQAFDALKMQQEQECAEKFDDVQLHSNRLQELQTKQDEMHKAATSEAERSRRDLVGDEQSTVVVEEETHGG